MPNDTQESGTSRFEVETEVTLTGSVQVEAESWEDAVREVIQMDDVELESRLTNRDCKTAGVYEID